MMKLKSSFIRPRRRRDEPVDEGIEVPIRSLVASPSRTPDLNATSHAERVVPNLWDTLSTCIGQDLTRISLPVYFNEPLSFIQRMVENIEYSELLDEASSESTTDPLRRATLVAAFLVSSYASTCDRTFKPFNPMLGETFELVDKDRELAVITEQVSHEPPVAALHASSAKGWTYRTSAEIRNRFVGNSIEVWIDGPAHLYLHKHNEHYIFERPHTSVHNIILGDLWLDNHGSVVIAEQSRGEVQVKLNFKRSGLLGNARFVGELDGAVSYTPAAPAAAAPASAHRGHKQTKPLSGSWKTSLKLDDTEIWRFKARPPITATAGYLMSAMGWSLNAPPTSRSHVLPPTDSRLRPDIRAHELGDDDRALREKIRLADKRRITLEDHKRNGTEHQPRWFSRDTSSSHAHDWVYNRKYFKARQQGQWPADLPDVF